MGLALFDLNVLNLPPSIRSRYVNNAGISTSPQVGHARFPTLTWLNLSRNKLSIVIPYSWFENISINMQALNLARNCVVKLPEILPVKPHLSTFAIYKNRLLTIPDMLNFPALKRLFIKDNPVTCDRKMCWRRLWDRKRTPLIGDDVRCQMPHFLRGTKLSNVNPKAMGCCNGKWPIGQGLACWWQIWCLHVYVSKLHYDCVCFEIKVIRRAPNNDVNCLLFVGFCCGYVLAEFKHILKFTSTAPEQYTLRPVK